MKKKTRRAGQHHIDYDYAHKLSETEKEWLTNFTQAEYYNDHKSLKKLKKRGRVTKAEKKRLNDMDHSRRRDIMTVKSHDAENFPTTLVEHSANPEETLLAKEAINEKLKKR